MISKIIDNLRVAYIGLVSNKLRSALTMLGITIGVAAVVLLVSIGQAVEHFVVDQFSAVGSNLIVVLGDVSSSANSSSAAANPAAFFVPLTEGDVAAISDSFRVPDLRVVAPNLGVVSSASYEGHEIAVQIAGVTGEYFDALHVETAQGRLITDEDQDTAARVVVVDERAADALFGGDYPIGKRIRIGDIAFEVVGVAENFGGMGGDQGTSQVYVPLASAQRYLSSQRTLKGEYTITSIVMEAISDQRVDSAISQVTQVLREEHDLSDDEDNDFRIIAQDQITDTLESITGLLTVFLGAIAGISLFVGGIGIMNIMLVTVTERTREIGLRKAVGAQRIDILLQFLIEAITLALVGGAIGTALAFLSAALVTALVPDLAVSIQVSSIILATLICIGIGSFFGAFPANRAAGLNPIDALRYE